MSGLRVHLLDGEMVEVPMETGLFELSNRLIDIRPFVAMKLSVMQKRVIYPVWIRFVRDNVNEYTLKLAAQLAQGAASKTGSGDGGGGSSSSSASGPSAAVAKKSTSKEIRDDIDLNDSGDEHDPVEQERRKKAEASGKKDLNDDPSLVLCGGKYEHDPLITRVQELENLAVFAVVDDARRITTRFRVCATTTKSGNEWDVTRIRVSQCDAWLLPAVRRIGCI